MDTGEPCHGSKNGRSFEVLALVMLGLLSVLCSAAGLGGESWAGTEMRISAALRHSPASLLFSLLSSQKGRHLISKLITCPNEMSAENTQVFKCCWNACRSQQSLTQGIIPVNRLRKVTKAVQGPRRPLTFICLAEGALALPPFAFPSPQCIPCFAPALSGCAASQGLFCPFQNKCKCLTQGSPERDSTKASSKQA